MHPLAYLDERKESRATFCARAGIKPRSLLRALNGNCTLRLAKKIVLASRAAPAPSGGTITYDDLAERIGPDDPGDGRRKRAKSKPPAPRGRGNGTSRMAAVAA